MTELRDVAAQLQERRAQPSHCEGAEEGLSTSNDVDSGDYGRGADALQDDAHGAGEEMEADVDEEEEEGGGGGAVISEPAPVVRPSGGLDVLAAAQMALRRGSARGSTGRSNTTTTTRMNESGVAAAAAAAHSGAYGHAPRGASLLRPISSTVESDRDEYEVTSSHGGGGTAAHGTDGSARAPVSSMQTDYSAHSSTEEGGCRSTRAASEAEAGALAGDVDYDAASVGASVGWEDAAQLVSASSSPLSLPAVTAAPPPPPLPPLRRGMHVVAPGVPATAATPPASVTVGSQQLRSRPGWEEAGAQDSREYNADADADADADESEADATRSRRTSNASSAAGGGTGSGKGSSSVAVTGHWSGGGGSPEVMLPPEHPGLGVAGGSGSNSGPPSSLSSGGPRANWDAFDVGQLDSLMLAHREGGVGGGAGVDLRGAAARLKVAAAAPTAWPVWPAGRALRARGSTPRGKSACWVAPLVN